MVNATNACGEEDPQLRRILAAYPAVLEKLNDLKSHLQHSCETVIHGNFAASNILVKSDSSKQLKVTLKVIVINLKAC